MAVNLANLLLSGGSLLQSKYQHDKTMEKEELLFKEEMAHMEEEHQKELLLAKKTYLISTYSELEAYCQELNENLISSCKESERDMADQRNQQYQNILISSTIMITALISVLIQGVLPSGASDLVVYSYGICNSVSLVFLSLTVGLCVQINKRVNKFLYNKSKSDRKILETAMKKTNTMMVDMKSKVRAKDNLVAIEEKDLEEEWLAHERHVHGLLKSRGEISEKIKSLINNKNNPLGQIDIFEDYWKKRLKNIGFLSVVFFYLGSFFMMAAVMLYTYAIFSISYRCVEGAQISVVTVAISAGLGIVVVALFRTRNASNMRCMGDTGTDKKGEGEGEPGVVQSGSGRTAASPSSSSRSMEPSTTNKASIGLTRRAR